LFNFRKKSRPYYTRHFISPETGSTASATGFLQFLMLIVDSSKITEYCALRWRLFGGCWRFVSRKCASGVAITVVWFSQMLPSFAVVR